MHRTASALLVVALCATAVGGVAFATTPRPEARAPLAVTGGPGDADPAASPPASPEPAPEPALDPDEVAQASAWQGPVNAVLAGIMADFPDDVTEAWLEGEVATVAFSGAAHPEAVERLRAMGRPFAQQEGLGITGAQVTEVVSALTERAVAVAPGRSLAVSAFVRDRTFTVEIGAPFDPAASGGPDLGMDADELEDRIRAGIPADDLAGFDVVATIDPSWSISY
jgi:hypothetical protein